MKVTINLRYRSCGSHDLVDSFETIIDKNFIRSTSNRAGIGVRHDYIVDEEKLIDLIGRWRVVARNTLLTVSDSTCGTAVSRPTFFKNWGKYFSSYVVDIELSDTNLKKIHDKSDTELLDKEAAVAELIKWGKFIAEEYPEALKEASDKYYQDIEDKALHAIRYWAHSLEVNNDNDMDRVFGCIVFDSIFKYGYPKNKEAVAALLEEIYYQRSVLKISTKV